MSGLFKGASGISLFLSIPFLINFLGETNYGVWVLVFSLFQLVLLMDFGVQSSLKTKIPILLHENKMDLVKIYIKSTYKISAIIACIICAIFTFFILLFDLKSMLNIDLLSNRFVNQLFLVNIIFFALNFVANIHKSLYVAFLKGKYAEESLAVNQFGILILTVLACSFFDNHTIETKLLIITFINGIFCLAVNIFYTVRFFKMTQLNLHSKEAKPSAFLKNMLNLGFKFMVIQVFSLFIFSFDNYIISNAFSPTEIVPYDVVSKIFQLPTLIIFAMLSPLWSMFAADYLNKNHQNLLNTFKRFNLIFIGIVFAIIILSLLTPFIVSIWIKTPLELPNSLIFLMCALTSIKIFTSFYIFFLSGIGNLNKYILLLLTSVVLKVPLSFLLINSGYGISSVVISTILLCFAWAIVLPYQSYSLVAKLKTT